MLAGAGTAILVLGMVLGVGVLWMVIPPQRRNASTDPSSTEVASADLPVPELPGADKLDQIRFGMTMAEVEAILGPGKVVAEADLPPPNGPMAAPRPEVTKQWGTPPRAVRLGFSGGKLVQTTTGGVKLKAVEEMEKDFERRRKEAMAEFDREDDDFRKRVDIGRKLEARRKGAEAREIEDRKDKGRPSHPVQNAPNPNTIGWKLEPDPAPFPVAAKPKSKLAGVSDFARLSVVYPALPSPLVSVDQKGKTQVWDLQTMEKIHEAPFPFLVQNDMVKHTALSQDGAFLAQLSPAKLETLEFKIGKVARHDLDMRLGLPVALEFFSQGKLLLGHDHVVTRFRIWDVSTEKVEMEFHLPARKPGLILRITKGSWALSGGGKYFAIPWSDHLLVFDLKSGIAVGAKALPKEDGDFGMTCRGLAFSPDGKELAGAFGVGFASRILVWDILTGNLVANHPIRMNWRPGIYVKGEVQWLPDGSGWLIGGSTILDRKSGTVLTTIQQNDWEGKGPRPRIVDADHIASLSGERSHEVLALEPLPWDKIKSGRK
jgi:hypothetical protein